MTRYQQTVRTSDVTTGHAALEILAGPMGCRVFAIKVVSASAAATELGVGRPAATGDSPVTPTSFGSVDGGVGSQSKLATAWGTVPTAPTVFFDRVSMPSGVGFVKEFLFPQGIAIQRGRSLTLHNITGGATFDVTVDLQESLNVSQSYADVVQLDGPVAYWRLNDRLGFEQAVLSDGPVAYWRFQEPSGTSVADATGNGHTMTLPGSHVSLGVAGALANGSTGLSADGTQAAATFTPIASGTSLSVEFWLNPGATALVYSGVLGNQAGGNGWYYDGTARKIRVNTPGGDFINNTALNTGQLYHVVITMDSGNITFYINGLADGTFAGTTWANISVTGALTLGGGSLPANLLDELALYSYPLSALQVANHYALRLSTIATVAVGAVTDLTSARLATIVKGAIPGASPATFDGGTSFQFDGITGCLSASDAAILNPAAALTIELWIRPTTMAGTQAFVNKQNGGNYWYLRLSGGDLQFSAHSDAPLVSFTPSSLVGAWSHVVGTYDGITLRLYLNGVQVASLASSAGMSIPTGGALVIGANQGTAQFMNGLIDEVAIYAKALTDLQVLAHFRVR